MIRRLFPVMVIVAVLSLALAACGGTTSPTATPERKSPSPPPPRPTDAANVAPIETAPSETPSNGGTKKVSVQLHDMGGSGVYAFDPKDLTFSAGEKVEITLNSETEFHTFTVEQLGIDESVNGGQSDTFSFTFDKPGVYTLICIPHQSLGMVGTITVK